MQVLMEHRRTLRCRLAEFIADPDERERAETALVQIEEDLEKARVEVEVACFVEKL